MSNLHRLSQIDMNLLVILDELLRSRSTTVAARRLGRTQSAVSHALARLRMMLDDPLFVRAGTALRPTTTAEKMQAPLRDILLRTEAVLARTGEFNPAQIERTFILGGADYAEVVLMPRLMPVLRREAPGIDIITRFLGDDLERAVQSREVDLAYGRFQPASGVVLEEAAREEMVMLLRRGHPALKKRMTVERYAALDHVLVSPRGLPGSIVDNALEPLGLARRVVLRIPHFVAAAAVVAKTDLAVTVPFGLARELAESLQLVCTKVPLSLKPVIFMIGYSTSLADDRMHLWFRQRVLAAGKN